MPLANINGIELYYEKMGAGDPVVFIPGLSGTTELWMHQTGDFSSDFLSISLDNRGAGRSSKPAGPYSMEMFARDLNDLLDSLEISEPVNLVGASMGGIIAQAFIHDYPQRVKRLVLACTGVSGGDPHVTLSSAHVQAKLASPGTTANEIIDTYLEIFYHPEFVARHPEIRNFFYNRKSPPQPPHAYFAQLIACADPRPYYEWLAEISVPVLVIHGREDLVWPLKNAETLMAGLGANARLAVVEDAGHILFQEQPENFNRILRGFLMEKAGAS
jgi:pimeloyl-ACP methyl ester carboxylesterase